MQKYQNFYYNVIGIFVLFRSLYKPNVYKFTTIKVLHLCFLTHKLKKVYKTDTSLTQETLLIVECNKTKKKCQ